MFSTAKKILAEQSTNGKRRAKTSARRSGTATPPAPITLPIHPAGDFNSTDQALDRIHITHDRRELRLALNAGRQSVFLGRWDWQILVDDQCFDASAEADSACWENNCWEENIDVSYSEMQLDLPSGLQIQRQMLLARRDRFAFVADVVEFPRDIQVVYQATWQLAKQLVPHTNTDTREVGLVRGRRHVARVLPLSLPEWKRQPGGELDASNGLTIAQPIHGRRGHVAVFIDLDPQRLKRQLTWRRLTVAESLEQVGHDVAVGYRIQVGKEQWLIYRSLAPAANRTVLGQNYSTEFVVARFRPNGVAEKMIEIL